MAYDEKLAERISDAIGRKKHFSKKKMFGGLSFLYKGKMAVGIIADEIVVRVVADKYEKWLQKPYSRKMDYTGRTMKEFLFIEKSGFRTKAQIDALIDLGMEHAKSKLK